MVFRSILDLVFTPRALKCFLKWKIFSFSAFKIVHRLKNHGVFPNTVIDVGANLGQFSIAAYYEFSSSLIIPIEPDAAVVRKLKKNLPPEVSGKVLCSAVGDFEGDINFQVNADPQNSSILPLGVDRCRAFPDNVVLKEVCVPISRLDSLLDPVNLPKPILLKIDVQGYEEKVVHGASHTLRHTRWVVMEISFARLYEGEAQFLPMIDLMSSHGFRFVKPLNFHLSGNSLDIIEMDALFERLV